MATFKPAAGRFWLAPLYDLGVRITMPEQAIRAWGAPASLLMRQASGFIDLIDGSGTTRNGV